MTTAAPLEVRSLTKRFPLGNAVRRAHVHAVDDVSFELRPGTITALVGESGSGKSTVARLLAHLSEPSAGEVLFEGNDVTHVRKRRDVLRYRSQVQIIFQDPFGSLNPVKTVRHHIERPLRIHQHRPFEPGRAAGARVAAHGRARPPGGRRRQVSARALGRPAAEGRDRPCARGRAEGRPRRRADQHARRLDSHRDPEPDGEAQGGTGDRVSLRDPRPRERALRRRRHPRHVRGADRRARADRGRALGSRSTRTRDCCSTPCRIRRRRPRASRSSSARATPRPPSIRARGAASACAARSQSRFAPTRLRQLVEEQPEHAARCHVTAPAN